MIHVRERLDERDSTESFLDIGDVVRGWEYVPWLVEILQARACRTVLNADKIRDNNYIGAYTNSPTTTKACLRRKKDQRQANQHHTQPSMTRRYVPH